MSRSLPLLRPSHLKFYLITSPFLHRVREKKKVFSEYTSDHVQSACPGIFLFLFLLATATTVTVIKLCAATTITKII
jgi:hypothetical protein